MSGKPIPLVPVVLAAVLAAGVQTTAPQKRKTPPPPPVARTEILWDRYGVPHVFAGDDGPLFRAFGWAQMEAHGNLILRLYAQARGRGAEFFGPSYLDEDKWVRTMGVPDRGREWYAQQDAIEKKLIDAFVSGVNDYAAAHPDNLSADARAVLPVTGADLLGHVQRVILFHFITGPERIENARDKWSASAARGFGETRSASAASGFGETRSAPAARGFGETRSASAASGFGGTGSNAWAIAPSRTAAGRAILVANPHLPWSDFLLWFEAQLTSPSVNAYGATLVGQPMLGIAFNDDLGWTHTNNAMDGADLYELTLDANGSSNGGAYTFDGAPKAFDVSQETIRVKQSDGRITEEPLTIKRSVQGPIVAEKPGKALALRVVGLDQPHIFGQYWQMARAHGLPEFRAAIAKLQNPFYTIMYADRAGHIMHVFGGRTPVRPAGPYDWAGIVRGDTSKTMWTATHAFNELPQAVDPASGWLQNANDPPWTTTFPSPLKSTDFPPYMSTRGMSLRAQRSARMLDEDPHLTFDKVIEDKLSTRMELADRVLDDLVTAAKPRGGDAAAAAAVLEKWDRSADAKSQGAVLFEAWYRELTKASGSASPFAVKWDPEKPRTTPSGLANADAAVRALETAARTVARERGAVDVAWGDVYRLRQDAVDLPANGGPGELGIFRVVGYKKDADGKFAAAGGDSYVAVIEFGPSVRAMSLVSSGNSSEQGSPHRTDQLKLFAEKKLKPVWRSRLDIEGNLEKRETIRP
jgi:acyl-homoserine-lactone acylase